MSKLTTAVCAAIALSAFGLTQHAWAGPKSNKGGASASVPKGGASASAPKGDAALVPGKNKAGKSATGVGQDTAPGKKK